MNILQINFSPSVATETIQLLHTKSFENDRIDSIKKIITDAGGEILTPVYQLSTEEIIHDNYGFARTFKLYLKPSIDREQAIKILQNSPLIEKVKPVGISKAFNYQ